MKFTKIHLHNYRQYKNAQFDFDNKLNIIIGENGIGKSTLMSAIIFALYGINEVSNTKLLDSIEYLANVDNYINGSFIERNTIVTLNLEIEIDEEIKQYEIIRTFDNYRYKQSKYYTADNYGLSNYENVVANEIIGLNTVNLQDINEITKFIPANIVPLLFFDGERIKSIESVIDSTITGKTEFRDEIERILQIETLKGAQRLIADTEKEIDSKIVSNAKSEKIKELTTKKIELKEILENAKEEKEKNILMIGRIEKKLLILSEQLKKHENIKNYKIESEKLGTEIQQRKKELENYEVELKGNLFEYGHQIANKSLFNKLYNHVSAEEDLYEISGIEQQAITDILKNKNCICGNAITEEMETTLRNIQKGLPPESFESMLKSVISSGLSIDEIKEKNDRLKNNYLNISRDVDKKTNQMTKLSAEILKHGDSQVVIDENEHIKLEAQKIELNNSISKCEGIILEKNDELKQIEKFLVIEENKEKGVEQERAVAEYLSDTKKYITSAIKRRQADISKNLQEKINENAKLLVRDSIRIKIDEKLKPSCQFVGGATSLSSGQSVMVSLSYLISLMQIAKEQNEDDIVSQTISYPIVMDGITAALDPKHIENMVESVMNTKAQIIFFVNGQTITKLEEAIINTQKLQSIENKKIYIHREKDTNETIVEVK